MTKTTARAESTFSGLASRYPTAVHELGRDRAAWAREAGLDWEIKSSDLAYTTDGKTVSLFPGKQVFYRSDTGIALATASDRFKLVQPAAVLDFYDHVAATYGFKLALAGTLRGGRKLWGMAETPHHLELLKGDAVKGGLFFVTACDGSAATAGFFTSFRMWCLNQLPVIDRLARAGSRNRGQIFRLSHLSEFRPDRVEQDLQRMAVNWDDFKHLTERLASKRVSKQDVITFLQPFFTRGEAAAEPKLTEAMVTERNDTRTLRKVLEVYEEGEGQDKIKGTAWGAVNAVTRYLDHEQRARDDDTRLNKSWVHGQGGRFKSDVFQYALEHFKLVKREVAA